MNRSTVGLLAGICGGLFFGYCIYLGKKKRSGPNYKKNVLEESDPNERKALGEPDPNYEKKVLEKSDPKYEKKGLEAITSEIPTGFSRLSTNVVPSLYRLFIRPKAELFYSGFESIDVLVLEETKTIVLNSLNIEILFASFVSCNQDMANDQDRPTKQKAVKIELNVDKEIALITFANSLEIGAGQLKLKFVGVINDQIQGIFRSKYKTYDDKTGIPLATQFDKNCCRRAFPCWNDPNIKAKFELILDVLENRVALSNMPVMEQVVELERKKRLVKFDTTPIMSINLFGFFIGNYQYIEQRSANGVLIRVYTPLYKTNLYECVLHAAVSSMNIIHMLDESWKVDHPLSKHDLVAISGFGELEEDIDNDSINQVAYPIIERKSRVFAMNCENGLIFI